MALGQAVRIVIVDRLCSLTTLLVVIALGVPHLLSLGSNVFQYVTILALALGVLGTVALAGAHLFIRSFPWLERVGHPYALSKDFSSALFGEKSFAMRTAFWGIANHLCRIAMVFFLAVALELAVTPLDVFALVPPALLIAMVPITVAGWGLREAVFIQAFSLAGIPADSALALSLLYAFVVSAVGLFGGVVWFAEGRLQRPKIKHVPDLTP
jgi:uncharacterized membrane protein YbhN (UPF0104 family)